MRKAVSGLISESNVTEISRVLPTSVTSGAPAREEAATVTPICQLLST